MTTPTQSSFTKTRPRSWCFLPSIKKRGKRHRGRAPRKKKVGPSRGASSTKKREQDAHLTGEKNGQGGTGPSFVRRGKKRNRLSPVLASQPQPKRKRPETVGPSKRRNLLHPSFHQGKENLADFIPSQKRKKKEGGGGGGGGGGGVRGRRSLLGKKRKAPRISERHFFIRGRLFT